LYSSAVTFDEHVDAVGTQGTLLAAALATAGAAAAIPTCPGWVMRDLVHHVGEVHRWATAVVASAIPKPSAIPEDYLGPLPDDDDLGGWFETGLATVIDTLHDAPADLTCFTFLNEAGPPREFWARRQAHELSIHRVDAESATATTTPFAAEHAVDGIDELLTGFVPRKYTRLRSEAPLTLQIATTDSAGAWHVSISAEPPTTVREQRHADCTVSGRAEDLYLALWNRGGLDQVDVRGDRAVIEQFRAQVQVSWS
jgi:uncharacterized protein (TIGR03083 family)